MNENKLPRYICLKLAFGICYDKFLDSKENHSINESNFRRNEPPAHRKIGLLSVTNTAILIEN